MKKIFFLAASMLASVAMMAQVDFQYLPTAGDSLAGFSAKASTSAFKVEAGAKLAEGTNFTVYNAYKCSYKVVGMLTDTAYAALKIGDVTVDYNIQRIQGQANPTAGGANPVIEMKCPNEGSCYKVDVKKDGWLYVAVKTTPNKQQFVFESVVENDDKVGGTFIGHQYLMQANKSNGTMCVEFVGDPSNYNQLMAPPAMPYTYFTSESFSTNGVGVLAVQVYAEGSPYIVGTAGSKMMACGFAFSETPVEVKAIGSKNITKEGWTGATDYDDVVLSDKTAATYKQISLNETPIFVRVKMPANEANKPAEAQLGDTTKYIWDKLVVDKRDKNGNATSLKAGGNIYAWMWGTKKDGTEEAGKWLQAAKSGNYYVLQIDGMASVDLVLNADGKWGDANHQTVDIKGIDGDYCVQVGDVPADKDTKCGYIKLDCLTGEDASGIENVEAEVESEKFVENGHLYIRKNGVIYNATGAVVK